MGDVKGELYGENGDTASRTETTGSPIAIGSGSSLRAIYDGAKNRIKQMLGVNHHTFVGVSPMGIVTSRGESNGKLVFHQRSTPSGSHEASSFVSSDEYMDISNSDLGSIIHPEKLSTRQMSRRDSENISIQHGVEDRSLMDEEVDEKIEADVMSSTISPAKSKPLSLNSKGAENTRRLELNDLLIEEVV